jgi:hypothetical protein
MFAGNGLAALPSIPGWRCGHSTVGYFYYICFAVSAIVYFGFQIVVVTAARCGVLLRWCCTVFSYRLVTLFLGRGLVPRWSPHAFAMVLPGVVLVLRWVPDLSY